MKNKVFVIIILISFSTSLVFANNSLLIDENFFYNISTKSFSYLSNGVKIQTGSIGLTLDNYEILNESKKEESLQANP